MDNAPDRKRARLSDDHQTISNPSHDNEREILSPLEQLPRELVWEIIDYAQKSVRYLLLTSQLMNTRLNEYVVELRDTIVINQLAIDNVTTDDGTRKMRIYIDIANGLTDLFEMRLKHFKIHNYFHKYRNNGFSPERGNDNGFRYETTIDSENFSYFLNKISNCAGKRIRIAWILEMGDKVFLASVSQGLGKININHFVFDYIPQGTQSLATELTQDSATALLKIIEEHNVKEVAIRCFKVTVDDPVALLLQLSSKVRSLSILQVAFRNMSQRENYLFGIRNGEWAPIILKMFANKLEKLHINDLHRVSKTILDRRNAEMLFEELPELEKRVWFEATHASAFKKNVWQRKNDTIIRADGKDKYAQSLHIKHHSRMSEPALMGSYLYDLRN